MKMSWYHRMMLSYTPIIYVILSSIIFGLFTMLNLSSDQRYMETNKAIVDQTMKSMESNLKLIERNAVAALLTDGMIYDFFSQRPKDIYDYYLIQKKLIDLTSSFPFAASIYAYDETNGHILSDSNTYKINAFADEAFLREHIAQVGQSRWSSPRDYSLSTIDRNKQKVVSIAIRYVYPDLQKGTIVINVYVSSLLEFLRQYGQGKQAAFHLMDAEGDWFRASSGDNMTASALRLESDYTGWVYYADGVNAAGYSALSLLSNVWTFIMLAMIILALVWFTVITHIHYKPVQKLVERIHSFTIRKSGSLGIRPQFNQFKMVESAIDDLFRKATDYNTLQEAEVQHRRRILLQELLAGHRVIDDSKWSEAAVSLGLPASYAKTAAVAVEIDRYSAFQDIYEAGDQHLLKYIMENAFRETANDRDIHLCSVWTEPKQVCFVLFLNNSHQPYSDTLFQMCNAYRGWIQTNLEVTVTVGIGSATGQIAEISQSYRDAIQHVSYKAVFGTNGVIDEAVAEGKLDKDSYALYSSLPQMIHFFKKGDRQWREKLDLGIEELSCRRLGRTELASFVEGIVQLLEKEILTKGNELPSLWREEYRLRLHVLSGKAETLSEMHQELIGMMEELDEKLAQLRHNSGNHTIAMKMKAYIEAHYADPGLSLAGVSETFDMPVTNASLLFKKETGEKFIDYVLRTRLHHAQSMLLETEEPIQIIAEKVGYSHVLSFHRAFKKSFGFPPGEYRSIYRTPQ